MKLALTGHTSGIGAAIVEQFPDALGFSRQTGHDLADPKTIERIVAAAATSDVFINNAFYQMAQVDLLYALHAIWHDRNKTIIVISSNSGDGIKSYRHPYAVYKSALDKAVEQLQNLNNTCRIINLRPGYVDTPRVAHISANKLSPQYIAMLVAWVIGQPGHIRNLTVTP